MWAVLGVCCALPVAWGLGALLVDGNGVGSLGGWAFQAKLLGRTIGYNALVAVIAVGLGLPVAAVIGRGRGVIAAVIVCVLPAALLLPSIVYAYGWMQVLRVTGAYPVPGTWGDVLRCVWTLGTWLWPIPAAIVGLAWRRMDSDLQQQALMDGGYWRVVGRQLAGPMAAALGVALVLAMQEFAVYEPTGISVVATEVRTVFETGSPGLATGSIAAVQSGMVAPGDQRRNAAAALLTAGPLLLIMAGLALGVRWVIGKTQPGERVEAGPVPVAIAAGWGAKGLAILVIGVTLILPLVAMVTSIKRPFDADRIVRTFGSSAGGTLAVAGVAGAVAAGLAVCGIVRRVSRGPLVLGVMTFLVGGQLLAIALVRIYNQPRSSPAWWAAHWVYNGPGIVVMAYLARFGWLAVWASRGTWGPRWREVREMAAIDGAGPGETARRIIWPLAWPVVAAAGVLIVLLSMTEVAATVILNPVSPRMFIPELMSWVHKLRDDDMLEGSLLLAAMVVCLAGVGVGMVWIVRRRFSARAVGVLVSLCAIGVGGCSDPKEPEAIWLETGAGEGQVVYPRAICYDKRDDSYYVCDRLARIQHLDKNGQFINSFRMPEWTQGKPVGMTVGPDGNLWVPDTHYSRVLVLGPQGQLIKRFGKEGKGPGEFIYPSDVAFDAQGRAFVSEFGDNDRIQVFDRDLKFLYAFGSFGSGPGQFSRPQSMAIVPENDGEVLYVTDACNHRISVWTTGGRFLRHMGRIGSGPGEFRFPYGLDIDAKGRLVVCEFGNNRVQWIDKDTGQSLKVWGQAGRDPGQLAYPWAVAVDKRDRAVAVDAGNNRLQVVKF